MYIYSIEIYDERYYHAQMRYKYVKQGIHEYELSNRVNYSAQGGFWYCKYVIASIFFPGVYIYPMYLKASSHVVDQIPGMLNLEIYTFL